MTSRLEIGPVDSMEEVDVSGTISPPRPATKVLVSVIIPSCNYSEYLPHCLNSCFRQSYPHAEYIIVDDGSTDGSAQIAHHFVQKDPRFRLVALDRNAGLAKAKNEGIVRCRGELITTIDADDMLSEDSILERVHHFIKNPTCMVVHARSYVCHGPGDFFEKQESLTEEAFLPSLLQHYIESGVDSGCCWDTVHAQTVMARRGVYVRTGLYCEEMRFKSDREMWFRMVLSGLNFTFLHKFVSIYRRHDRNMSTSRERRESNIEDYFQRRCAQLLREGVSERNCRPWSGDIIHPNTPVSSVKVNT